MAMAFKVIGDVEKVIDSKGKVQGFGVLVEIYFPGGEKRQHRYTARRKKEVIEAIHNGKMARWVKCACLDDRGNLVFQLGLC